jgi:ABC-type enterobactin transport system permease subunit
MKEKLALFLATQILQVVENSGATKQEATAALNAAVALAPACLTSFGPVAGVPLAGPQLSRLLPGSPE